jgi:hypothetical protein
MAGAESPPPHFSADVHTLWRQTRSAADDKLLRKWEAEHKLLDGVSISRSIGETPQGVTNKNFVRVCW